MATYTPEEAQRALAEIKKRIGKGLMLAVDALEDYLTNLRQHPAISDEDKNFLSEIFYHTHEAGRNHYLLKADRTERDRFLAGLPRPSED
jgi:hypothetical protein